MIKDFTVLIVGRENVGKSSLFNRLINRQKSIVDDYPGVTRDKIYGDAEWMGRRFKIIDTGGLLFNQQDRIKAAVAKLVQELLKDADLVLFMTDVNSGLVNEDREIFQLIKRSKKDFVVVVNKADSERKTAAAFEFHNLGVETIFPVSVTHSIGLDDLLDYIVEKIPRSEKDEDDGAITKLAIVGKENVGKSSLFNALVNEERSIVTEIPGTTRDSVDTMVEIRGKKFLIMDTAGVKKRKSIRLKAEEYSIGRAFSNIKNANMALHVIDATEGIIEMDKKVLGYALEHFKAIIIVVNKWDLVKHDERDRRKAGYIEFVKKTMPFVDFVPLVFVSAKEKRGLEQLIDIVFYVENQYNFRVKTSLLNKMFQKAMYDNAPSSKKGDVKIYYISQVEVAPPTFAVFVNKKEKLHFSYLRYIENRLREAFGFTGAPLKLKIKARVRKEE